MRTELMTQNSNYEIELQIPLGPPLQKGEGRISCSVSYSKRGNVGISYHDEAAELINNTQNHFPIHKGVETSLRLVSPVSRGCEP